MGKTCDSKGFFRSKPITQTYNIICNHPDSPESQWLFSALNFGPSSRSPLSTWHEFIRRLTYHIPKVTKTHEFKVLSSYSALLLHCRRATYIVKLTLSSPLLQSPFLFCFEQFGWHNKDGNTQITWETGHPSNVEESSDSEHDLDSADDTKPEQADSSVRGRCANRRQRQSFRGWLRSLTCIPYYVSTMPCTLFCFALCIVNDHILITNHGASLKIRNQHDFVRGLPWHRQRDKGKPSHKS